MKRIDEGIHVLETVIGAAAMAVIATIVFCTIIGRYFLSTGILWADEVVVNLFVLMVMIGSALCFRLQKHTEMTLFLNVLPKKGRIVLHTVIQVLTFVFLLIFLYSACLMTKNSIGVFTTVLRIPMAIIYGAMPLGGVLMLYEFVKSAVYRFRKELKSDKKGKLDVVGEATKGDL